MIAPTEAYPLVWPTGVARTSQRNAWPVRGQTIGRALDGVRRELRLMRATNVVISSNLPLRNDGQPRADAPVRPGGDPGVAIYWSLMKRWDPNANRWVMAPYCMPCDRWTTIADNLHAIELSIGAMRGMERWGAVSLAQAFAGFAALPPGTDTPYEVPAVRPWREVLGGFPTAEDFDKADLLAIAKARYRRLIEQAHPDRGGDVSIAAELNAAIAAAEQELSS